MNPNPLVLTTVSWTIATILLLTGVGYLIFNSVQRGKKIKFLEKMLVHLKNELSAQGSYLEELIRSAKIQIDHEELRRSKGPEIMIDRHGRIFEGNVTAEEKARQDVELTGDLAEESGFDISRIWHKGEKDSLFRTTEKRGIADIESTENGEGVYSDDQVRQAQERVRDRMEEDFTESGDHWIR